MPLNSRGALAVLLRLTSIVCVFVPSPAFGWGTEGHRAVAELAGPRLTPAAAHVVELLLGEQSLADVAVWADDVRRTTHPETYRWHFVNIPLSAQAYDENRDCRVTDQGDCIIAALTRLEVELANPGTSHEQRREALMFVIHLVGDLHQPLHASDNNDAGGNGRAITAIGGATNLHSAWDSGIIHAHHRSVLDLVTAGNRWLKGQNESALSGGRYVDWAMESLSIAKTVVYAQLQRGDTLDERGSTVALDLIEEQLARAGVRLAAILNRMLGDCRSCH
jgi:hypothetical protein